MENYLLDLILVFLIAVCIILSMKKGFIGVSKSIVSVILTWALISFVQPAMLGILENSALGAGIKERVSENISAVYERESFPKDTKTTDTYAAEEICSSLGFPLFLESGIKSAVSGLYKVEKNVMDVVTNTVTLIILRVLSLVLLFLFVRFFVFLLVKLLELIFELPVLKTINKTLGAVFGILYALFIVYALCAAVSLFAPADSLVAIEEAVGKTYILKYFYESNILMLLFV